MGRTKEKLPTDETGIALVKSGRRGEPGSRKGYAFETTVRILGEVEYTGYNLREWIADDGHAFASQEALLDYLRRRDAASTELLEPGDCSVAGVLQEPKLKPDRIEIKTRAGTVTIRLTYA